MNLISTSFLLFLSATVHSQNDVKPTPAHCLLPELESRCLANIKRYRYDAGSKLCVQFTYGGCGGNENMFRTLSECVSSCGAENRLTPPARCLHLPDAGRCDALFTSTYFDSVERKCKLFDYGGCGGNENRFSHASECKEICEIYE